MPLSRWVQVKLPHIFERMLGFSLPVNGNIAIISYEGIHVVNVEGAVTARHDRTKPEGGDLYDDKRGVLNYNGVEYNILGVYGGKGILESETGEKLHLDLTRGRFVVSEEIGNTTISYSFKDMSGDWAKLTFSEDSRYILLGMPCELYVYKRP